MSQRYKLVVGAMAVVVVVMVGYISGRLMVEQRGGGEREQVAEEVARTRGADDVIIKGKTDTLINYKMYGAFVTELYPEGKFWTAPFVVTGDPQRREIQVYVGTADGRVLWGEYQDNIRGASDWRSVPTQDIVDEIEPGVEMTVEFSLPFSPNGNLQEEVFLDQLKQELLGKGSQPPVVVPEYLGLAVDKIGGI